MTTNNLKENYGVKKINILAGHSRRGSAVLRRLKQLGLKI